MADSTWYYCRSMLFCLSSLGFQINVLFVQKERPPFSAIWEAFGECFTRQAFIFVFSYNMKKKEKRMIVEFFPGPRQVDNLFE